MSNTSADKGKCRVLKRGTEETISKVFLPCITALNYFSPEKRQQHHCQGEAGQSKEKTQKLRSVNVVPKLPRVAVQPLAEV